MRLDRCQSLAVSAVLMQVGACIVNQDKKIVGIGYNGFPRQISDDDPEISWGNMKEGRNPLQVKYPFGTYM